MTINGPAYYCSALWPARPGYFGPFVPGKECDPCPGALPVRTFMSPVDEARAFSEALKNRPCDLGEACFVCHPRRVEAP